MKQTAETDYIQQLISEGEHVHQDFKFAISDARKIARSLSAFANTEGGRLLVGVKDNGRIAGIRSEEEIYMIEAAATMYCRPPVITENRVFRVEGKDVLEVEVKECACKPVLAVDEEGKAWAYVRIANENILASPVHLRIWNHEKKDEVVMTYTDREKRLLEVLGSQGLLTLGRCSRLARLPRPEVCQLLADFIRFGLVEQVFQEHTFFYRLKEDAVWEDSLYPEVSR